MTDMIEEDKWTTRSGSVRGHDPHMTGTDWGYDWKAWRVHDVSLNQIRIYVEIYEDGEHLPDTEYRSYRASTKKHDLHWVDSGKREDIITYLKNQRMTCKENYKHVTPLTRVQDRIRKKLSEKVLHLHEKAKHDHWLAGKRRKLIARYGHGYGGQLYRDRQFDMI